MEKCSAHIDSQERTDADGKVLRTHLFLTRVNALGPPFGGGASRFDDVDSDNWD